MVGRGVFLPRFGELPLSSSFFGPLSLFSLPFPPSPSPFSLPTPQRGVLDAQSYVTTCDLLGLADFLPDIAKLCPVKRIQEELQGVLQVNGL